MKMPHEYRETVTNVCRCGKTFTGFKNKKFCSTKCQQAAKYAKQKTLKDPTPEPR